MSLTKEYKNDNGIITLYLFIHLFVRVRDKVTVWACTILLLLVYNYLCLEYNVNTVMYTMNM